METTQVQATITSYLHQIAVFSLISYPCLVPLTHSHRHTYKHAQQAFRKSQAQTTSQASPALALVKPGSLSIINQPQAERLHDVASACRMSIPWSPGGTNIPEAHKPPEVALSAESPKALSFLPPTERGGFRLDVLGLGHW